jgi:hypothetical protein
MATATDTRAGVVFEGVSWGDGVGEEWKARSAMPSTASFTEEYAFAEKARRTFGIGGRAPRC